MLKPGSAASISSSGSSSCEGSVRVFCRVRPLLEQGPSRCVEVRGPREVCVRTNDGAGHDFTFDGVFESEASQDQVYCGIGCDELVRDVLNGYNATVFAYGQTASGKSYTMEGSDGEARGIIPRAAASLFQGVAAAESKLEFAISVSFVEIYMEKVRDLLDPSGGSSKTSLQIREDPTAGIYVSGCTASFVTNESELLQAMAEGRKSRATAATGMNEGSSRSHSVFECRVSRRDCETESRWSGKLVLVDLAGSEMVRKTHATGQQLEEAKTINKSLSALGQVINALTDDAKSHVPYRDSKLTRMLQDSLGGNAKTVLIVNVSAATSNAPETLSTLRFGKRAKAIKNTPRVNERKSVKELTALLRKAEAAIDMQSAYIAALEQAAAPEAAAHGTNTDVIDELRLRLNEASRMLDEEKAENEQRGERLEELKSIVRDKERRLAESEAQLAQAQTKLEEIAETKDRLERRIADAESNLTAAQDRHAFQVNELELELEKLRSAVNREVQASTVAGIPETASCNLDANLDEPMNDASEDGLEELVSRYVASGPQRDGLLSDIRRRDRSAPYDHQRQRLLADLKEASHKIRDLEQGHAPPDDATTRHALSLQQRLEQLVTVHRQLLRKYAALELNLSEAAKKIALRDERITKLEADRARPPSLDHLNQAIFSLSRNLDQLEKKASKAHSNNTSANGSTLIRTLRGGSGGEPSSGKEAWW